YNYFYRKWVNHSTWTPWEKIDTDIEGDHILPVVYNRRLYVFWFLFQEVADKGRTVQGEDPNKNWEISLAWSEYKNGKWSARQTSSTKKILKLYDKRLRKEELYFKPLFLDNGKLWLMCCHMPKEGPYEWLYFAFTFFQGKVYVSST